MEKIEIRNVNGFHLAFFKGLQLPLLIESVVNQDASGFTTANLLFEVELENINNNTFEIKGSDLIKKRGVL